MTPTSAGSRTLGSAARGASLAAALAVAFVTASPAASARADGAAAQLVQEANRKVRQHDVAGARALLEQAIAAEPGNLDANVRYQDLLAEGQAAAKLQSSYAEAAKKKPDDLVAQFLAARLLPPDQALAAYEKLADTFKTSPWPSAGKARALESLGRFGDALVAHSEALARAGDQAPRFLAYRAYSYERAQQWQLAAEAWKAVVARAPKDLAAHLGLAEALRRDERPDESLAALDAAAKAGVSDPEISYRRGLALADARKWDEALAALDAAAGADAGMFEAVCAASEVAVRQARDKAETEKRAPAEGDFTKAIAYGDRATVTAPESPYPHFVLGAAHEAASDPAPDAHLPAALREYEAALQRQPIPGPDKVRTLTAKAFIEIQLASWDAALDSAQKAIDIDRACMTAWGHAGHALAAQGKQQEAISRCYRPALKVDPQCARILHDLGVALWELKKEGEAKKPLEEARNLAPRVGQYRLTLGEYYYATKKNKEAVAELLEATDLLPRDPQAWRSYGRACCAAKSWDECVKAYEKVVALDPESVDEWLYMAVVLAEQLKDKDKAKQAVQKFREKGGQDAALDDWINELLGDPGGGK